jgi:hypothetical protein
MDSQEPLAVELDGIAFGHAHNDSTVSLDSPAASGTSKRKAMKKKLSKIAFPFGSGDSGAVNNDNKMGSVNGSSHFHSDGEEDREKEEEGGEEVTFTSSKPYHALTKLHTTSNSNISITKHSATPLTAVKTIPIVGTPMKNMSTVQKSRSNSATSSSSNTRYQQVNSSSHSLVSPIGSKTGTNGKRANTHSPQNSAYYSNNSNHLSPLKMDPRYLATTNDHAFLLSNKTSSLQPPPLILNSPLPSPSYPTTKTNSHSTSGSIDEHYFAKHNIAPTLPQFSHTRGTTQTVLAPPTVLAPIYKTSSSQSISQNSYNSTTSNTLQPSSSQLNLTTVESTSNPNSNPTSSTNSQHTRQKRGTGLLQSAYRASHAHSKSNGGGNHDSEVPLTQNGATNDKVDASQIASTATSTSASNITNSTNMNSDLNRNYAHESSTRGRDHRYHLISPQIINQFQGLQQSVQLRMKKRIEAMDSENAHLLHEVDAKYEEFEKMENQLQTQLEELNKYIDILSLKKDNEINHIRQDGLFEKLNDLSNRIDTVKAKMDENKSTMQKFESQLDALESHKHTHEARNKNLKQMASVSALMVIVSLVFKCWFF